MKELFHFLSFFFLSKEIRVLDHLQDCIFSTAVFFTVHSWEGALKAISIERRHNTSSQVGNGWLKNPTQLETLLY